MGYGLFLVEATSADDIGTVHGAELMAAATPEISLDAARAIADFARGRDDAAGTQSLSRL